MFGYVRPDKAELKIKDYETYKAVYCSVCRTLGSEYGVFSRFLLTYDAAFYVFIMKTVFENKSDCAHRGVCRFNPLKKCNYIDEDEYLKSAAALTVIMFYYKILDNIKDSKFFKRLSSRLLLLFVKPKFKKAIKNYSHFNDIISLSMEKQAQAENEEGVSLDKACDSSARALADIFTIGIEDEEQKRLVDRTAYCLGRWVYLMDAFDDLESDIKTKSFNPFVIKYSLKDSANEEIEKEIIRTIRITANETASAFELLQKNCYKPVIENIIFDGMENELQKIINKRQKMRGEFSDE